MKFDTDFVKRQLLDIAKRNSNCFEEYTTIIKSCCTKLMSTGMDLYGMFWPEPILAKYFEYKGKLTSNNDKKILYITLILKISLELLKDMIQTESY